MPVLLAVWHQANLLLSELEMPRLSNRDTRSVSLTYKVVVKNREVSESDCALETRKHRHVGGEMVRARLCFK